MDRVLIMIPILLVAVAAAVLLQRRRPDAPTQSVEHVAPAQLDRRDFARPEADWLVAAFTSATCDTCSDVVAKVEILASDEVAIDIVEYGKARSMHERYRITAVPTVVICDAAGVVRRSFLGPTSASHLWAAVAEVREPGSLPEGGCGNH
ncbi:MAG: hypothetical protein M9952_12810 [Microthrixaceae bacterium]|nr:hypothetical protein [Microthrixaceae bacterium]MCO5313803.1 hypothetical protein [Microthrixaceae bacterium]